MVDLVATNDTEQSVLTVPVPSFWPAAITSSLAVAVAAGFVALSVREVTGSTRWAIGSALVLVLGTGIWLNGAFQLWQHGPSSMWIAAAGWASIRGRWHWAGLAFGAAILTRPPVALIAAAVGVYAAWRQRNLKPMILVGLGASVGAIAVLGYNYWLFDTITISGGYSSAFTEQLVETDTLAYVRNVWGGLFSLQRGLLVWSPIVAVGAFGALRAPQPGRNATMGGLIGGVILLLVQYKANRYSGGEGFFSYRYPIESVVAAAPALALGAKALVTSRLGRLLVVGTVASSVLFHLTALVSELGGS
jgi:alpha-1,2-mannosyltransferase